MGPLRLTGVSGKKVLVIMMGSSVAVVALVLFAISSGTLSKATATPTPRPAARASPAGPFAELLSGGGSGGVSQGINLRYSKESSSGEFIEFRADGSVQLSSLGAVGASYSIDGDVVTVSAGVVGGATGHVQGDRIVFDSGYGGVGGALVGGWVRR